MVECMYVCRLGDDFVRCPVRCLVWLLMWPAKHFNGLSLGTKLDDDIHGGAYGGAEQMMMVIEFPSFCPPTAYPSVQWWAGPGDEGG